MAADALGNLYIGDGDRIRKISADGIISTVTGGGNPSLGDITGFALSNDGNLFFSTGYVIYELFQVGTVIPTLEITRLGGVDIPPTTAPVDITLPSTTDPSSVPIEVQSTGVPDGIPVDILKDGQEVATGMLSSNCARIVIALPNNRDAISSIQARVTLRLAKGTDRFDVIASIGHRSHVTYGSKEARHG